MTPFLKGLLLAASALVLGGPCLAVLGTVIGRVFRFQTFGEQGAAKPEELASSVSLALLSSLCRRKPASRLRSRGKALFKFRSFPGKVTP